MHKEVCIGMLAVNMVYLGNMEHYDRAICASTSAVFCSDSAACHRRTVHISNCNVACPGAAGLPVCILDEWLCSGCLAFLHCVGLKMCLAGQSSDFKNCTEIGSSYRQTCSDGGLGVAMMYCAVALAVVYLAVTYLLLLFKLRSYKKQAYSSVQVGLVYNTLQVRCTPGNISNLPKAHCL